MTQTILPATEATMAEVEAWLDAEEALYRAGHAAWIAGGYDGDPPVRGFRCNWDSVKRTWREGSARVDILVVDGEVIGFLDSTDILEIRPDLRGRGYGRTLAEFMIATAFNQGRSVVEIEIAPESAEPFWRRMGFTVVPDRRGNGGGIYAYRILPHVFSLGDGERVPYAVSFYDEDGRYETDRAFSYFSGEGERLGNGSIQLPERAYCFRSTDAQHVAYFAKIEVDSKTLFFDKAKRDAAKACGVQRDPGYIYFIDRITPPTDPRASQIGRGV